MIDGNKRIGTHAMLVFLAVNFVYEETIWQKYILLAVHHAAAKVQ